MLSEARHQQFFIHRAIKLRAMLKEIFSPLPGYYRLPLGIRICSNLGFIRMV
jgi:hypothetical protein